MSFLRRILLLEYASIPKERYIDGYANRSSSVTKIVIKINGTSHSVNIGSDGYWRYDISQNLTITSLENMFNSESSTGGNTNNNKITHINLANIGNTSNNTSLKYAFNNCTDLASISFGSNFNTSSVTTIRNMCSGCFSLKQIDMSMFVLSSIPESPNDPPDGEVSNVFYMHEDYGTSALQTVKLPLIPCRVSSNFFKGCKALRNFYTNGIKYEFKISDPVMLSVDSIDRIINGLYNWSNVSTKPNNIKLYVSETTRSLFTNQHDSILSSKGWEVDPAVKSNVYVEDFDTASNVSDNGRGWYKFSASSGKLNVALDEHASYTGLGSFIIDIPSTYNASNGLYVIVDVTVAKENEIVEGVTTTNNNFNLYMMIEDSSGHKTPWARPDGHDSHADLTPGSSVSKTYHSEINLSGITTSSIRKVYFTFIGETDTLKERKKGLYIKSMTLQNSLS